MKKVKKFNYDVFLSYSSADDAIVRYVAEQLREVGLNVWFDKWIIKFGDDIYLSIEAGLEQSQILILFISSNALKSDWVSLERSTALFRDPTNKNRRFIPVVIDECEIPDILKRYSYLDLQHNQDLDGKIAELIEFCCQLLEETSLEQDGITLTEYRKAHSSKYSTLIEGRHIIKVKAVNRLGSIVDASVELESWIKSSRSSRLAVLGDPGSGKTYLLRQLCSNLSGNSQFTPIFINAGQLRNRQLKSRTEFLAFADPPVPNMAILDSKNIIIVIDGLDELIGPTSHEQIAYSDTLNAVGQIISKDTRLIISCRSTTFEATSNAVSEAFVTRENAKHSSDATDDAIRAALGGKYNSTLEQIELVDLTKEQAWEYLLETVGRHYAQNPATSYVIKNLPRVPVILRFLELALPELGSIGRVDLDELYSVALQAWVLRDPAFINQDVDTIWEELKTNHSVYFDYVVIKDETILDRLVHSGLLSRTPSGAYRWSHFSIAEFFLANSLCEEISMFNANTLAGLNLIGSYNINRFLVPLCRRKLLAPKQNEVLRLVTSNQYDTFLEETGWRRMSGYGFHPSYIAKDGTGFTSGIDNLKPEPYTRPKQEQSGIPVCGLSWYDAFAYCLWSGESLPKSTRFPCESSLLQEGLWYWCIDWSNERKAHVAVSMYGLEKNKLQQGGVNPDFRHSRIALATVQNI